MNTSPYVDPGKPSQEIWEEFSMSFTPAVREVVEFAKRIPGFRDLSEHDQVSLLKAGTFEVRGHAHLHPKQSRRLSEGWSLKMFVSPGPDGPLRLSVQHV